MQQTLVHPETQKQLHLTLEGQTVTQQTTRRTSKTHNSAAEALKDFQKRRWNALKKGFIYQEAPVSGQAYVHRLISLKYTGCLSMVDLGDQVAVYCHHTFENDWLHLFDPLGHFQKTIVLPRALPWSMAYAPTQQMLYLTADHTILAYDRATQSFETWAKAAAKMPASFVAVAEDYVLYGAAPKVELRHISTGALSWSKQLEPELYRGHSTLLCGGISPDGQQIALCHKAGQLLLFDAKGTLIQTLEGHFEMVQALHFIPNHTLLIHEKYGTSGIHLLDLNTGEPLPNPFEDDLSKTVVYHMALDATRNRLAVSKGQQVTVYDLTTFETLAHFSIEHCVKTCAVTFVGAAAIGVRTDYGCFSLYAL